MPTALITGASSGIGAAFARRLAKEGYDLVLVARRQDRLEALAAECTGVTTTVVPADLARPEAPDEIYAELEQRGIQVDLLINNAGLGKHGPFVQLDNAADRQMIDLNITALTAMTRRFVPGMVERKNGGVINVASTASFQPIPFMSIYAATKAYVLYFSEGLAEELAPHGVKVSCLCPGPTETEFTAVAEFRTDVVERAARFSMSADEVAAQGLSALRSGRRVHVTGLVNFLTTQSPRITPRILVSKISGLLFKPQR